MEEKRTVSEMLKADFSSKDEIMSKNIGEINPYLNLLANEMGKKVWDLKVLEKFFEIVDSLVW